ncbi:MAG: hypothetical protein M3O01_16725, partial [Pseudomonadota bacterium]|nr:hypothetical protein [Pseudomonadota bacterium]
REVPRATPRNPVDARTIKPLPAPVPERLAPPRATLPAAEQITVAAPVKGPKQLCGDMNFLALAMCVSRQCQTPALQAHPECVESRRYDEQRRRRMEQ